MMNNTILNKEQKEALDKVVSNCMPHERGSLEDYMLDEIGEDELPGNLGDMTNDELYALAKENSIDHIWVEFYHLSNVK